MEISDMVNKMVDGYKEKFEYVLRMKASEIRKKAFDDGEKQLADLLTRFLGAKTLQEQANWLAHLNKLGYEFEVIQPNTQYEVKDGNTFSATTDLSKVKVKLLKTTTVKLYEV